MYSSRYDFASLKAIREFDDWVEKQLGKISSKGTNIELDFEDWDNTDPGERKGFLEEMLSPVKDGKKKSKFSTFRVDFHVLSCVLYSLTPTQLKSSELVLKRLKRRWT